MKRRAAPFRLPVLAQDVLLALFITVMQVQGNAVKPAEVGSRPLTDLGHLGYVLLIVSGLVLVVRRRWPVPVFVTAALARVFPDEVWECTHLGGHRFAPTALVLPTGYSYGRLDQELDLGGKGADLAAV